MKLFLCRAAKISLYMYVTKITLSAFAINFSFIFIGLCFLII